MQKKALQLGFVDGILFNEETHEKVNPDESSENTSEYQKIDSFADKKAETDSNTADFRSRNTAEMIYTPMHTAASFMQRVSASAVSRTVPFEQLEKRLELLKYWR